MFYSSVREIWENLIKTYSMKKDSTACYDIESKIFNSRQGTLYITKYYGKEKLPSLFESEKTQRSIMLDKGCSNKRSAMVTGKDFTKISTSKGKPFTKRYTKDTCYKLYGKEKVLEQMDGNKGPTQMWVNQTTSDKENFHKASRSLILGNLQRGGKLEFLKTRGESYLEVELVIESLPFESLLVPTQDVIESLPFLTQDVQFQVQEVTKPIMVPEQVQLSKPKSPRAWFGRFAQVVIFLGYRQSQGDDEIEKLTLKEKLAT
ncbi:hypothetical protein CR513_52223, partial [Mucuna pruriens]